MTTKGCAKVSVVTAIWLAICCIQDVTCYNPYAYNPSFFQRTSPDSYSTMGDVNWAKRSPYSKLRSLMEPQFGYASMADADWGWKKRSDENVEESPEVEALGLSSKRGFSRSYKYRQPYMRARPRADRIQPHQAYARYGAIARPQTRKLGDRQYAFYSMADADWGWKKRSELPARLNLDDEAEEAQLEDEMDKRNIASLLDKRSIASLLDKRSIASLAGSNMFPAKSRVYGKRAIDDLDETNMDLSEEEKN